MATREQVVEKHGEGLNPAQIAEALQISRNGVYNHLRRSGISLNGRGGGAKRGRATNGVKRGAAVPLTITPRPDIPNGVQGEHPSVTQIRSQIGDSIENLELEMHLKREELTNLGRQHQQLYDMLTVPLPAAPE